MSVAHPMLHPMLVVQVTALTAPVLDALDDAYALPCEGTGIFPLQASGHVPEGRGDAPCGLCELRGWRVHRGQEPAGEQKTHSVGGRECARCGRVQGSSVVSDGVTSLHHYGATPVRAQATLNHSSSHHYIITAPRLSARRRRSTIRASPTCRSSRRAPTSKVCQ